MGLECQERLLRLDVAGCQRRSNEWQDYDLRIAFEHENSAATWGQELCKLCHVVADLRVLIAYYGGRDASPEPLERRISMMADRMTRVPNSQWLFIWGSQFSLATEKYWQPFTLGAECQLVPLVDDNPLCPAHAAKQNAAFAVTA
jgi:hypothetical protein